MAEKSDNYKIIFSLMQISKGKDMINNMQLADIGVFGGSGFYKFLDNIEARMVLILSTNTMQTAV